MRKLAAGILLLMAVLCGSSCQRPPQQARVQSISTEGTLRVYDVQFYSPSIGGMLRYRILLPKPEGNRQPPVLYLLHGANSGPEEIVERSALVSLAGSEGLAVVMPEGKLSYFTNAKHPRHARWEDAVTHDLVEDVQAHFPVGSGPQHTGIAGISMGGYAAAKIALKHPGRFGFVGIISGALDITSRPLRLRRFWQSWRICTIFGFRPESRQDEDVYALVQKTPQVKPAAWFVSCGVRDPLYGANLRFTRMLRQHGVRLAPVTTQGGHDWRSWNEALPVAMHSAAESLRQ